MVMVMVIIGKKQLAAAQKIHFSALKEATLMRYCFLAVFDFKKKQLVFLNEFRYLQEKLENSYKKVTDVLPMVSDTCKSMSRSA